MINEDDVRKLFERVLKPECPECGAKLSVYPYYDSQGAFRICPKCKKTVRE